MKYSAARLIGETIAAIVRPRVRIAFSEWLPKNIKLVDGPNAGEMWNAAGAPYLVEPADCLSEDHPCNEVTIRKSQQTGASILALAWSLYCADQEPANFLYACPGIEFLRDMNNAKLQPLIDAWQKHTRRDGAPGNLPPVIIPQIGRAAGASASTTYEKVFAGGRLWLGNAHSELDMSGKTAKKGVRDEFSKWKNQPGFGDPDRLFFGRFTAFRRKRNYKILNISTPEIDTGDASGATEGHCRISLKFEKSDQRKWNCTCPECGRLFVHHMARFRIDEKHPHHSTFECFCGHHITESERVAAVRAGRWIPSIEDGTSRHPGFDIDAFMSLMVSYGDIASEAIEAQSGETGRKNFSTLWLGKPYRMRGDAPDHMRLYERREDYPRGVIPPGALLVVVSADVQMRGIYYEVLAIAPDRQTWVVEADYLDGETTDHDAGAFAGLSALYHRKWPDTFGNRWPADEFGIDANYRTGAVLTWTRRHPGTKALQGRDGWGRPALSPARDVDVSYQGRTIKGGAKLRGVGTWNLKSTFYSYLALPVRAEGSTLVYPNGYCHFGSFLDEAYFKQITAEHLAEDVHRGRKRQIWKLHTSHADNHWLDCRIYNMALADPYLASFMPEDWLARAKERSLPEDMRRPDLFAPRTFQSGGRNAGQGPEKSEGGDGFAGLSDLNKGVWG